MAVVFSIVTSLTYNYVDLTMFPSPNFANLSLPLSSVTNMAEKEVPVAGCCGKTFGSRFKTMNSETNAYLNANLARGPLFISILFLGTVFLQYANLKAGCTKDGWDIAPGQTDLQAEEAEVDCTGKAYGLAPSSILSSLNTVAGLFVAITLPLIGSIVDHTSLRKNCVVWGL
jgi:hypothetical protein